MYSLQETGKNMVMRFQKPLVYHVVTAQTFQSDPEDYFIQANSADADEMLRSVAFHLGLCSLPKYPFMDFQYTKG